MTLKSPAVKRSTVDCKFDGVKFDEFLMKQKRSYRTHLAQLKLRQPYPLKHHPWNLLLVLEDMLMTTILCTLTILRVLAATVKRLKTQYSKLHFISPSESNSRTFLSGVITDRVMVSGETKSRVDNIFFRRLGNLVYHIHWSSGQLYCV